MKAPAVKIGSASPRRWWSAPGAVAQSATRRRRRGRAGAKARCRSRRRRGHGPATAAGEVGEAAEHDQRPARCRTRFLAARCRGQASGADEEIADDRRPRWPSVSRSHAPCARRTPSGRRRRKKVAMAGLNTPVARRPRRRPRRAQAAPDRSCAAPLGIRSCRAAICSSSRGTYGPGSLSAAPAGGSPPPG